MDARGIATAVAATVGVVAVLRQRNEAHKVRSGALSKLGATGQPDRLPTSRLHGAIARWQPPPPRGLARAVTTAWSAPLTALGLGGSLLGGVRPTRDAARGCLVARGVGGLPGAFLRGQGAGAATIGKVVLSRHERPSPMLLDHEAVHVRQQERLGLLFAVAYPLAQARWGYRANPFEVAARAGAATAV